MQILIMHNPEAGSGKPSSDELIEEFNHAGYETKYQSTKENNYQDVLDQPQELIVVAGGDGTIAKVAKKMVGKSVPLSILPLGTANNIAKTFCLSYTLEGLASGLKTFNKVKCDVGSFEVPGRKIHFLEAVGLGLFPAMMKDYEEIIEGVEVDKKEEVKLALQYVKTKIKEFPAQYCKIMVDEELFEGNFLLVEIMNIKTVGPNLPLASGADPGDGALDVVMVREEQREEFRDYIHHYMKGESPAIDFTTKRGSEIKIFWNGFKLHVDDDIWPDEETEGDFINDCEITLKIGSASIEILVPDEDMIL